MEPYLGNEIMVNIKVIKINTQIWDHMIPYFFECPVGTGRLESIDGEISADAFREKRSLQVPWIFAAMSNDWSWDVSMVEQGKPSKNGLTMGCRIIMSFAQMDRHG